jgi:hypothetical protein
MGTRLASPTKTGDFPRPVMGRKHKSPHLPFLLCPPLRQPAGWDRTIPGREIILLFHDEQGMPDMVLIYVCCLSAGIVVFLLAEDRNLPVRIGLGVFAFLPVSLIVTLMMVH